MIPVIRIHGPSIYISNVVIKYSYHNGLEVTKHTGSPLRLHYLTTLHCASFGLHINGDYEEVDILGAVIRYNSKYGMYFDPRPGLNANIVVKDSIISDNGLYGIYIRRGVITIFRTNIINHAIHGICSPEEGTVEIRESRISQSGDWAVYIVRSIRTFIFDTIFEQNGEFIDQCIVVIDTIFLFQYEVFTMKEELEQSLSPLSDIIWEELYITMVLLQSKTIHSSSTIALDNLASSTKFINPEMSYFIRHQSLEIHSKEIADHASSTTNPSRVLMPPSNKICSITTLWTIMSSVLHCSSLEKSELITIPSTI
jgi:hypothetical protein